MLALQRLAGNGTVAAMLSGGGLLPPALRREAEARFGPAAAQTRVHVDQHSEGVAAALDAEAFTIGTDVFVRPDAYAPTSGTGRTLLLHELAHVAQHHAGLLPGSRRALEQQADRAARSPVGEPALARALPQRTARPPAQVLLQKADVAAGEPVAGEAASAERILKVRLYRDQDRIELVVEGFQIRPATLIWNGRPLPGVHTAVRDPATGQFRLTPPITTGTSRDGFIIRWSSTTATLRGVRIYVVEVIGGPAEIGAAGAGGMPLLPRAAGAGGPPRSRDELWRAIQRLPEHIRGFLTAERGPRLSARDYETVLTIGQRLVLEGVTPEELYAYRRSAAPTRSVERFAASIEAFLEVRQGQRLARARNIAERQQAQTRLYGLKELYLLYRRYSELQRAGELAAPGAGVFASQAATLRAQLAAELPRHGFADLAEFEAHIYAFVRAFRRETLARALDLLLQYEYLLVRADAQFRNWDNREAARILADVGAVRGAAQELYRQAESKRVSAARAVSGARHSFDFRAAEQHLREAQEVQGRADELVARAVSRQAVVGWQDFPRERLLRQRTATDVRVLMGRYILEHIVGVRRARKLLEENPDRIFELDRLLLISRRAQGIEDGSIYELIIRHRKEDIESEEFARNLLIAIVTVALSVVSFGAGSVVGLIAAGAAFGLSAYQAVEEIRSYDEQSQLYVAQLLSNKPSVAWAVVAVVGAAVDGAAVVRALKVVGPAAEAFNASGDLVRLQEELAKVDARIARNVERAAAAKRDYDAAIRALLPTGKLRMVIMPGGEEFLRLVAVAYYMIKRGWVTFERFLLELRQLGLIKDIAKLTPEELTTLKQAHQAAIERSASGRRLYGEDIYGRLSDDAQATFDPDTVDQFAAYGRALGRRDDEVVASIESSARTARDLAETRAAATARGRTFDPSEVHDVRRSRTVPTTAYDPGVGDSARLAANLRAANRALPGPGYQAHHIIPSNEGPQELRDLLRLRGLDINAEVNGVWLPTGRGTANLSSQIKHEFLTGSAEYFSRLRSLLIRTPPLTRDEVIRRLRIAAEHLAEGRLPPRRP